MWKYNYVHKYIKLNLNLLIFYIFAINSLMIYHMTSLFTKRVARAIKHEMIADFELRFLDVNHRYSNVFISQEIVIHMLKQ